MLKRERCWFPLIVAVITLSSSMTVRADDAIDPIPAKALQMIEQANAHFQSVGSSLRITEAWFFTVGRGTDPYRRLRTGSRWPTNQVSYILDESDYVPYLPSIDVDNAMVRAYDSWNDISNTTITANRAPDTGGNFDVLDGLYDSNGNCVFLFDLTSPNLDWNTGLIYPEADIVMGGWVNPKYFSQCLGSSNIIGVTWTFSDVDSNSDQYDDRLYVEQFYNPQFPWVTSGAVYLDYASGFDVQTITVHENGHAHGLGHFGGPNANQPFKLQPNGKVFDPEAVMNPFYLGGEKRDPMPTDVAGLRTLYGRKGN